MSQDSRPDFETPVGVLDLARVRKNASRVASYCREHGLAWRPHIKTHKSLGVARVQLDAGARGLTVATLREAEVMSTLTGDILLAYPPIGEARLARLMALPAQLRLSVALDSQEVLEGLAGAARAAGRTVDVLVELDVGLRRTGLAEPGAALALARRAQEAEGVRFAGLLFYPGHIRVPEASQGPLLAEVSTRLERVLELLDRNGLRPDVVSGGSTPTLWGSHHIEGLTEVRAGSCIFNDREGLSLGVAELDDVAYTVAATVVSTAVPEQAVVDAGSKALAKEARSGDGSFGVVFDRPEVPVIALSEEHGVLDLSGTAWRPSVGDLVRIIPNHVCVSLNLQDHVVTQDGPARGVWPLEARGRAPYVTSSASPAAGWS